MSQDAAPNEATLLVQRQLDAYNDRAVDAYMACWAEDAEYYEFPSKLLAQGAAEIRQRHVARFSETNLHATLVKRINVGNLVIDQETVTRTFPEGPGDFDAIAIYEVVDGKIAKAWFKMGSPRLHPTSV